ncbi:C40 family peptidase [Effusibacillus lacus]|uniref:Endopeptidase n=1 Tax=Effusibacillus lacus TaxID=1348429 RepID=A0A292YKK6_9BACL|nr:NlpC/P60 family protein [Effusibacillus lacus]TCS76509.1 putative peptidoglycan binding protein [Effusibacillus lacus]GAX90468.1 endopeptidase [Effusibacillus lacus]
MNRFWKAFVFAGALLFASATVSHAEAASKYGDKTLEKEVEGQEVATLQQDLRILGYFKYPTNTGYYGEITEAAVKAFQKDNALEQTGKVDPDTTGKKIAELAAKKLEEIQKNSGALLETAKSLVGVPYAWGGTTPSGFDCSGFVRYVFSQKGVDLARTSHDMYKQGTAVTDLQPGDLVFFATYDSGASHVGIYLGDGQFISSTSSHGVKIDSFSSSYWGPRYLGARRI